MYTANLHNRWCSGDFATSGRVAGTMLDDNTLNFPKTVQEMIVDLVQKSEIGYVNLDVEVVLKFEREQIPAKLEVFFENKYNAVIPQWFKGKDPKNQLPAVTSGEMFKPLVELISPVWVAENFVTTQEGDRPTVKASLVISDLELSQKILTLAGYGEED